MRIPPTHHPLEPLTSKRKQAGRQSLTVRGLVIGLICLAGAIVIQRRTGDLLMSAAAFPILHGFLSHWVAE